MVEIRKLTPDEEKQQKEIAYFSALVSGHVASGLEMDKALIMLSSAGIGFLITMMSQLGIDNFIEFVIFIFAFISFFIVIVTCLIIFSKNKKYIENIVNEKGHENENLDKCDKVASFFFLLALIFIFILGANYSFKQLTYGGNKTMAIENAEREGKNDSLNGLNNLNPEKKSVDGLNNLNPGKTGTSDSSNSVANDASKPEKK